MSETIDFKDMVKGLPTANSASGNVMTADAQGAVSLLPISSLRVVNLNGKEAANTELDVKEFHTRYMKGLPVGTVLTDRTISDSSVWRVKIANNLKLSVQSYLFLITKNQGQVGMAWSYMSFLALPSRQGGGIYRIDITVYGTVANTSVQCWSIPLTSVTLT